MRSLEEIYHAGETEWREGDFSVHRGFHFSAPGCHNSCGMLFYMKDGKLDRVEGDPLQPYNQGRLCMRCLSMMEIAYSEDRLKYPMKRARDKRGKDAWERISWDEALDIIEAEVNRIRDTYGAQSIMAMEGTGRGVNWQVPYLCYTGFGSPNFVTAFLAGDSCAIPRMTVAVTMLGGYLAPDFSEYNEERYDHPEFEYPETLIIWGANTVVSSPDGLLGWWFVDGMREAGTKLVVVDPQVTWLAAHAEVHIQPRPGTDAAVAMAMCNVIIQEGLYDWDFINCWCTGFEEFAEAVSEWTPERAAEVAWCDAEDIRRAARLIATNGRCAIQTGVSLDMSTNGTFAAQAAFALVILTGNIDKPGTNLPQVDPWGLELMYSAGYNEGVLSDEMKALRLDNNNTLRKGGFSGCASADQMLVALETGDPYPLKMCWIAGANPITCMGADAPRVYKAMRDNLDFTVVIDYVMTPTAMAVADLVLPCAMSWERNFLRSIFTPVRANKKCGSYYEAKSEEDIVIMVGKRVNPEHFAQFETDIEFLQHQIDLALNPRMSFVELADQSYDWPKQEYRRYEKGLLRGDGSLGFNTPSGRIELDPSMMKMFGMPSLPVYEEPVESPISTPDLFEKYPLVLTTGGRDWAFFHSEGRNTPSLRNMHVDPLVKVNPADAKKFGVKDGDWVWVENQRGRCRQRVLVNPGIMEGVVMADHAWWFPERKDEAAAPSFFGTFDSNVNNLTQQGVYGPHGFGSPYRGLLCRIYKCTEENSRMLPSEQIAAEGR